MPAGRPTDYTIEIATKICELVAIGGNLDKICVAESMPSHQTVYAWFDKFPEFLEMYNVARGKRADTRSDRIDGWVGKLAAGELKPEVASVIISAEKWQAGRENPRRYGDKVMTELTGKDGGDIGISVGEAVGTVRSLISSLTKARANSDSGSAEVDK